MEKHLKVYKGGLGVFVLDSYQEISDQQLIISYSQTDPSIHFEKDDCIWFLADKEAGRVDRFLIVEHANKNEITLRRPGGETIPGFRDFVNGEKFTIITTFREEK